MTRLTTILTPLLSLNIFVTSLSFSQTTDKQTDVRQTIWTNFLQPLIDNNRDTLIKYVNFPLHGDWAGMMGYKEPGEKLGKTHFLKRFDKLFTKEFIEKTKAQSYKDISKNKTDDFMEYQFSIGFVRMVDGFKAEGGIILRFKKIKETYKLYLIQGVGAGP